MKQWDDTKMNYIGLKDDVMLPGLFEIDHSPSLLLCLLFPVK